METKQDLIFVDSSVWAAYFNGVESPAVRTLDSIFEGESATVVIHPIVLSEVLQGFRSETGFEGARSLLTRLPILPDADRSCHVLILISELEDPGILSIRIRNVLENGFASSSPVEVVFTPNHMLFWIAISANWFKTIETCDSPILPGMETIS